MIIKKCKKCSKIRFVNRETEICPQCATKNKGLHPQFFTTEDINKARRKLRDGITVKMKLAESP